MISLTDATDYIILKTTEGGDMLSLLKLQKLVYYTQAWHLAFFNSRLFNTEFEAWVHGPVSRDVYRRFASTKTMYAAVTQRDMASNFDQGRIPGEKLLHIDSILEGYAGLTGSQLEEMSHREEPWIRARGTLSPSVPSQAVIQDQWMTDFYKSRLG